MTYAPARSVAAVVGVVLAAAVNGCAPTSSQTPRATVPATLPAADTGATTPGPTVTATPFIPTPIPTGRSGTPAGGMPPTSTLNSPDPDVVAAAALTAYYRADTNLDFGPADTHRRALPWTTGQLLAGIRDDRPVTGPGATWNMLAAHRRYATVTVTRAYDGGAPTETTTVVHREYTVTVTLSGRDGWTGAPVIHTDVLTMLRFAGSWRITTLDDNP